MFIKSLKNKSIHFIGLGGSGMIGLCQFLVECDQVELSGSDINKTSSIKQLIKKNVRYFDHHSADHISDVDIVVYSTAISADNVEFLAAKEKNKQIFHRAEFLIKLMSDYKDRIIVSGTHGKTTSTGMLINIFKAAKKDPSFSVGGQLNPEKINGKYKKSNVFIAESDESDGSFLKFQPTYTVLTNVEPDHIDFFESYEKMYKEFKRFINKVSKKDQFLAVNKDDKWVSGQKEILKKSNIWTFSTYQKATCQAKNIIFKDTGTHFDLFYKDNYVDTIQLNTFGIHNIYNALGACSISLKFGIPIKYIKTGLKTFYGVNRRLQFISNCKGVRVYDDYGHHPTAIRTTLEGLKKSVKNTLICIFQPHRYSRTENLLKGFSEAFNFADKVVITSIYAANESNDNNVCSNEIVKLMKKNSDKIVHFIEDKKDVVPFVKKGVKRGDVIVTMGAGDINTILDPLVVALSQ